MHNKQPDIKNEMTLRFCKINYLILFMFQSCRCTLSERKWSKAGVSFETTAKSMEKTLES